MSNYPKTARSRVPRTLTLGIATVAAALWAGASDARATSCEGLSALLLPNTTVTSAKKVSAGGLTVAPGQDLPDLPAFCRVLGTIRPTADSDIRFEVWLPSSSWNGRYQQVGNGGLAGSIPYNLMASPLQRAYAVAATDDGHQNDELDGSWALGHPEKVKDFGYRAVHLTSEVAKRLVAAFYSRSARHSYFVACSEGGREAQIEAQRYPDDFNGILVGSPANYWTELMVRFLWDQRALLDQSANYIPPSKLPAVQAASLAACTRDGSRDGFAANPSDCRWDPAALLCPTGADSDSCLTAPQVAALRAIYAGPSNPETGQQISTGYERTGENSSNWNSYIIGTAPGNALQLLFSTQFYKGFVFEDANWDYRTFDFDHDVAFAREKLAATLDATNPDLHAFQLAGGKMIQYHGWIDASPQPRGSIKYYENVVANQVPRNDHSFFARDAGLRNTQSFYRLFMVPGMEHCAGGPGPNAFGQPFSLVPPPSNDAGHDAVTALERWVEHGRAPDEIIATKYVNDDPASGIQIQRPLCPYPQEAQWSGQGSADEAKNYTCQ